MPKRKVRHALITYVVDGRQEMAFRGQTVDLSSEEVARFEGLGAVVPADAELERPGTLATLPESPTDEELVAWCLAASDTELRAVLAVRPELGPRIEGAQQHVRDTRDAQVKAIEAAAKSASGAPSAGYLKEALGSSAMLDESSPSTRPVPTGSADGPEAGSGGDTPLLPGDDGSGPSVTVSDPNDGTPSTTAEVEEQTAVGPYTTEGNGESYPSPGDDDASRALVAQVIVGNVDDVTGFVADNPELATAVLEAETEARALQGKEPRSGIVKAVQAAQGHTQ